jgi:hypothetical protein
MVAFVLSLLLLISSIPMAVGRGAANPGGYRFNEGVSHTTIHFETYRNLILIPAQLNDTLRVTLILDTGTRSLLLYGKRFKKLQLAVPKKKVRVTGWGSPNGVEASLSFPNAVAIGEVRGTDLGIAVVTDRKLFNDKPLIDGIIGYELFVRFAVEINYKTKTIKLYDRLPRSYTDNFIALPIEVDCARPLINTTLYFYNNTTVALKLLIDTGSSLGLTVFTTDKSKFYSGHASKEIGIGLSGRISGYDLFVRDFVLGEMKVRKIRSSLVEVVEHPDKAFAFSGSLGAEFLKEHVVVFDYPESKVYLKSVAGRQ